MNIFMIALIIVYETSCLNRAGSKCPRVLPLALAMGDAVLVSAGIELIVFLVAGTVLCFEFSMRRMLTLMFSVVAK